MLDPLSSKLLFKEMLKRLKERNELDSLMQEYLEIVLNHRIYHKPSRGRWGEQGKDIVTIENNDTGDYCSYIIKCGNLQNNLNGKFGILKQLEDALYIEVEDYKGSKRTAVVIYNGDDGTRGSVEIFNRKKSEIKNILGDKLLRDIERWDLEVLTNKIFPHAKELRKTQQQKNEINRLSSKEELLDEFIVEINENQFSSNIDSKLVLLKSKYIRIENTFGKTKNTDELK